MKNIGTVIIVGLLAWLVIKGQQQAPALLAIKDASPQTVSEYELLHATVPITGYVEKQMQVFTV